MWPTHEDGNLMRGTYFPHLIIQSPYVTYRHISYRGPLLCTKTTVQRAACRENAAGASTVAIDSDRCAHAICRDFAWRRSPDTEHAAPLLERRKRITTAQNSIRLNRTTAIKRERQFSINKQQIAKNKTKDSGVNVRRKLGAHHMKKLQVDHLVGRARVCPTRATRNIGNTDTRAPVSPEGVLSSSAPHSDRVRAGCNMI